MLPSTGWHDRDGAELAPDRHQRDHTRDVAPGRRDVEHTFRLAGRLEFVDMSVATTLRRPQERAKGRVADLTRELRSVELFAGAGGLALGLQGGGFRPLLAIDSDEQACETLRVNQRRGAQTRKIEVADVRKLSYEGVEGVDLVAAGAPCQPFSVGGRLRGEDDARNMFPEVVRALRLLRPRAFVLENVRGLLFPRVRPYFEYLVAELRAPSRTRRGREDWKAHLAALVAIPEHAREYRVDWRVLNAADFGLAQNRPRLVVVGIRNDEPDFRWPEETHNRDALIEALLGDEYWKDRDVPDAVRAAVRAGLTRRKLEPAGKRWTTLRDLLRRLGPPRDDPRVSSHVFVPGARLYRKHTGSVLDWPAKTVKAGVHGCPGGEHIVLLDDGSYRYLTVRECAALQGFPDDYVLPELRTLAMRQLGNAVPVALADAVGKSLAEVLTHE